MDPSVNELLEALLRECARVAPAPLYPAQYAEAAQMPRAQLDNALDKLRLGGLMKLTDWVPGQGQGYALTPEGAEVARTPRLLDKLRRNGVTALPAPAPLRAVTSDPRASSWERGEAVRRALLEPARPIVTSVLILANLAMFLVGLALTVQRKGQIGPYLSGKNDPLAIIVWHDIGGMWYTDLLVNSEWWRLLSHAFVHIGLLHIFLNMSFLFSLGPLVEDAFGPLRFLALYLTSALAGGAAVTLIESPMVAGASGALCGVFSAFIVWFIVNRNHLPAEYAWKWMRTIVINVVLLIIISMMPGISAAGHAGGAVGGALLTFPFLWERYRSGWRRWLGLAGILLTPAAIAATTVFVVTSIQRHYHLVDTAVEEAYGAAHQTYRRHGFPLLTQEDIFEDEVAVRDALSAFKEAQGKLKIAMNALDDLANPPRRARNYREYFQAWSDFYTAFTSILHNREWNAGLQEDLVRRKRKLDDLSPF